MTHEEFLKNKNILSGILRSHFIVKFKIHHAENGLIIIEILNGYRLFIHVYEQSGWFKKNKTIFVSTMYIPSKKFNEIEHVGIASAHHLLGDELCEYCVLSFDDKYNFRKE